MRFYLGTHLIGWLHDPRMVDVPLFVSRRRLFPRSMVPFRPAVTRWALDSGGFQELELHGKWMVPPEQYVQEVRRCMQEIGMLDWAAVQDWMCEPRIRERTGMTVEEHQSRTIESYQTLHTMAPDLPWAPVLQGWTLHDYHRHVEMYERNGIDLSTLPVVCVGSVCRRQGTHEAAGIIQSLASLGLRLHGFGFKTQGLALVGQSMVSADSMAWSFAARREAASAGLGRQHRLCSDPSATHRNCANCLTWAKMWHTRLLASALTPDPQLSLWDRTPTPTT